MCNAIACHPAFEFQPAPSRTLLEEKMLKSQSQKSQSQLPREPKAFRDSITLVYILSMTAYDMEHSTGQSGAVALATLPPGFWCACTLAGDGKLKGPRSLSND